MPYNDGNLESYREIARLDRLAVSKLRKHPPVSKHRYRILDSHLRCIYLFLTKKKFNKALKRLQGQADFRLRFKITIINK